MTLPNYYVKHCFDRTIKDYKEAKYNNPWTEICIESPEDDKAFSKYELYGRYYIYKVYLFTIDRVPSGDWYSTQLRVSSNEKEAKKHLGKMIKQKEKDLESLKAALNNLTQ